MSDEQQTTVAPAGIQVISQYVKDMSFENPNAPESLVTGWPAPDTNVQILLGKKDVQENTYECLLHLKIEARQKNGEGAGAGKVCFIIDLQYAGLVRLHNIPAEQHQPVVMVEVPKLLFPFARQLVANTTSAGGYPPLYLAPISFEQIYVQEMQRLQTAEAQA